MPATELLGSIVTFQTSTDLTGATLKKTIVCEETSTLNLSANVNETKTKCGTFVAVDTPTGTVTINGVVNGSPEATELSFNTIAGYVNAKTKLYGLYQNAVSGSVALGTAVYASGTGYFTSAEVTSQEGDLIKFTASFSFSGTIDTIV
jgi:hypothetical protein